jgi:peptidoglycan/xylan/chitin deacetylase (PgdA/CDA1 family)
MRRFAGLTVAFVLSLLAMLSLVLPQPASASSLAKRTVSTDGSATLHDYVGADDRVWLVHTQRRLIALTFDDGPYPFYTPLLLHVLDRSHVHATFFCVGRSAQEFPDLMDRIIESGDEVGNHTFNHIKLSGLSITQIADQIIEAQAILASFVGHRIDLFRPPHGRYDRRVIEVASAMGYRTILWSDSPEDTKDITPALEVERVMAQARPGAIVLLHSGQYRTIESLPVIIDRLRAQGYTFVTVDELLAAQQ